MLFLSLKILKISLICLGSFPLVRVLCGRLFVSIVAMMYIQDVLFAHKIIDFDRKASCIGEIAIDYGNAIPCTGSMVSVFHGNSRGQL